MGSALRGSGMGAVSILSALIVDAAQRSNKHFRGKASIVSASKHFIS
jgi:hypothetical protein